MTVSYHSVITMFWKRVMSCNKHHESNSRKDSREKNADGININCGNGVDKHFINLLLLMILFGKALIIVIWSPWGLAPEDYPWRLFSSSRFCFIPTIGAIQTLKRLLSGTSAQQQNYTKSGKNWDVPLFLIRLIWSTPVTCLPDLQTT